MRLHLFRRVRPAARLVQAALPALVLAFVAAGCDTGPAESLYDPDFQGLQDPVITAVSPEGSALAGVSDVTITGQNFSADPSQVFVYFGPERAQLLSASPTELRVKAPNLPRDGLPVRVSVVGAENFSNTVTYRLEAAASSFGNFANFEEPFAIATDAAENVYVSLFSSNVSVGIKRITPEGERSDFVATTFKWDDLTFGPDAALYGVRSVRAVFRFAGAGSAQETWAVVPDNSARLVSLDFDDVGNLWTGGSGGNLYRIGPDKTVRAFPFEANVRAVEVFGGHLYVVATRDATSTLWRFPITAAGELGPAEVHYAVSEQYGGAEALTLAATTGGNILVGTDAADPVLVVRPDRSAEVLFPGVLQPAARAFAWGAGATLYMARSGDSPGILRINTLQEGSP